MINIKAILSHKQITQGNQRKLNIPYEIAKEYGDYLGLPPIFVLRLFKLYGRDRVLNMRSFFKDIGCNKKQLKGLIISTFQKKLKTIGQ